MSNPHTPPLAREILDVIVSSFHPSQERTQSQFSINAETLKGRPIVVSRLLTENPWEKAALAEIYVEHVIRGSSTSGDSPWMHIWRTASREIERLRPYSVFIESGSTCVYVSELLRRLYAKERCSLPSFDLTKERHCLPPFPLETNNHLTAWLFLNRQDFLDPPLNDDVLALVPYLFAGRLESKYHGIFPFYREKNPKYAKEERDGYAQLRLSLARSDLLLLAASRLSLKYGPLVGSRENAIFKNACYNACVPRIDGFPSKKIHLFITVQKLVAHNAINQDKVVDRDCEGFTDFHTWREELDKIYRGKCFPAFDLPLDEDSSSFGSSGGPSLVPSSFSTDLIPDRPQRLRDGTFAVEMGDGRFRICHTWQELFTKAQLTVIIYVAFIGEAVESDPNYQWIKTEVDGVRESFETRGIDIKLKSIGTKKPTGNTEDFSLVSIEIGPISNA